MFAMLLLVRQGVEFALNDLYNLIAWAIANQDWV